MAILDPLSYAGGSGMYASGSSISMTILEYTSDHPLYECAPSLCVTIEYTSDHSSVSTSVSSSSTIMSKCPILGQ